MDFVDIKPLFPHSKRPRINFGVWQPSSNEICILGREVFKKGPTYYDPDIGKLLFARFKNSEKVQEEIVLKSGKQELLEDPRAWPLKSHKVLLGLTAVLRIKSHWIAYPAITTFDDLKLKFGDIKVLQTFGPGKNTTPLKENIFLFRPARREFYHKFLVFNFENDKGTKLCEMPVPQIAWGKWKIGASAPPIWLNENKALLFIAGINMHKNKYTYSIGKAVLEYKDKKFKITKIDDKPIIIRETFESFGIKELHPKERKVVYMCGTAKRKEFLDLYVNVGDRNTFVVTTKLADLL